MKILSENLKLRLELIKLKLQSIHLFSKGTFQLGILALMTISTFMVARYVTVSKQEHISKSEAAATYTDPQYIFVRKDPTCSNCYKWDGNDPSVINLNAINEIYNAIGTKGTQNRKVGIGVVFFYNQIPLSNLKSSLRTLLDYSYVHDFPVFIALDGFEWWENRPDLWNWWDPKTPGYNPANINNVEWTCWSSSCATKIAWRNWGAEYPMRPHPNIASPTFIAANKASLTELVPIISDWYKGLPEERKYLLGGVSTTVEQDIGANYYYYLNGVNPNAPSPGPGLAKSIQLGYASIKTAGIKTSGTITDADIDQAIKYYETAMNQTAYSLGIPRNKIFNHNGGKDTSPFVTFPEGVKFETSLAAINSYAQPGWSLYWDVAQNPQNYSSLATALNQTGNGEWGSPEWLPNAGDSTGWITSMRNSLNYRNNRFISIANWEGIRNTPYVLSAIRTVANESICWVISPNNAKATVNGNTVNLTWQNGTNNKATYLLVSNTEGFSPTGLLNVINITNAAVTGKTSYSLNSLANGKYFWQLVTDGCTNQRRIFNGSFVVGTVPPSPIPSTPTPTPTPTITPQSGSINGWVYFNNCGNSSCNVCSRPGGQTVTIKNGTTTIANCTTANDGSFSCPNIPVGTYTASVSTVAGQTCSWGSTGTAPYCQGGGCSQTTTVTNGVSSVIYFTVFASLPTPTPTPIPTLGPSPAPVISFSYGNSTDIPVAGNWIGGKTDYPAIARGNDWYMKTTVSGGNADIAFSVSYPATTKPRYYLACDWTGSGKKTPAMFSDGIWYIRTSNTSGSPDLVFGYGIATDIPVCGNWTGRADGVQTIGVFRDGLWYLRNSNSAGGIDIQYSYGSPGDKPVVGHWTGTNQDFPGVYRNNIFYLRNSHSAGFADSAISFGITGDVPIIGDWTGAGKSRIGVVRGNTWYLNTQNP